MITELELKRFANLSVRGERRVYYTGDLMYERYREERRKHRPLEKLGALAWSLYEQGLITLIQRRVSRVNGKGEPVSVFEYIAVKL